MGEPDRRVAENLAHDLSQSGPSVPEPGRRRLCSVRQCGERRIGCLRQMAQGLVARTCRIGAEWAQAPGPPPG